MVYEYVAVDKVIYENETIHPEKGQSVEVKETDIVIADEKNHFEVDRHETDTIVNKKEASCTEKGYTGDKVRSKCGKELEKG